MDLFFFLFSVVVLRGLGVAPSCRQTQQHHVDFFHPLQLATTLSLNHSSPILFSKSCQPLSNNLHCSNSILHGSVKLHLPTQHSNSWYKYLQLAYGLVNGDNIYHKSPSADHLAMRYITSPMGWPLLHQERLPALVTLVTPKRESSTVVGIQLTRVIRSR